MRHNFANYAPQISSIFADISEVTEFSPLSGAILQSPIVQQQQSTEKTSQIRREQLLRKNVAAEDDEMENQVENSEEVQPARREGDEDEASQHRGTKSFKGDDGAEHVDVTA